MSRDSQYLVTLSEQSGLQAWGLESDSEAVLEENMTSVSAFVLCKKSHRCAWITNNKAMRIWDLDTSQEVRRTREQEEKGLKEIKTICFEVLADDETAIQSYEEEFETITLIKHFEDNRNLLVWSLKDCSNMTTIVVPSPVLSLSSSLTEAAFICGCKNSEIQLWRQAESGSASQALLDQFQAEWSLRDHYSPVTALAWLTGNSFVSGFEDGTVALWKIYQAGSATRVGKAREHNSAITSFEVLEERQFITCSRKDPLLKWWRISQFDDKAFEVIEALAGSLSLAVSRENKFYVTTYSDSSIALKPLYCEDSEEQKHSGKSIPFDPNVPSLSQDIACMRFNDNTNVLHYYAANNHYGNLLKYLESGVPSLFSSVYGSPLTVAIKKKHEQCRDVIMRHLIGLSNEAEKDEDVLAAFYAYKDDLLPLLKSGCVLLVPFLEALKRKSTAHPLIKVKCMESVEDIVLLNLPYRSIRDDSAHYTKELFSGAFFMRKKWMELYVCTIQMNLQNGSVNSLKLLEALNDCPNTSILTTSFASAVIRSKWEYYYPFTLGMTLAYLVMLACMVEMMFHGESRWVSVPFLAINVFFLLYERVQIGIESMDYLNDPLNYIDLCRGFTSVVWVMRLMTDTEFPQWLPLAAFSLCFYRGFTYFRSFRGTRIYVYMTKAVLRESMSFFVILAYTVCAFGILFSILMNQTEEGIGSALAFSYNLTLGEFDTGNFSVVEWAFFAVASITNIIVILNLLISILGDAFSHVKETTPEKDLSLQLNLLLEYEQMQPTQEVVGSTPYSWLCKSIQQDAKEEDEVGTKLEQMDKKINGLEQKLDKVLAYFEQPK